MLTVQLLKGHLWLNAYKDVNYHYFIIVFVPKPLSPIHYGRCIETNPTTCNYKTDFIVHLSAITFMKQRFVTSQTFLSH